MLKPGTLILLNFLGVALLLQFTPSGWGEARAHLWIQYGRPFATADRNWTIPHGDYVYVHRAEADHFVRFHTRAIVSNMCIIIAIALAGWLAFRKLRSRGFTWSRITRVVYLLTTIILLAVNIWFIITHGVDTQTLDSRRHSSGWPVTSWMLVDVGLSDWMLYADVLNGIIMLAFPLLVAVVCERIDRRRGRRA
jgi:hypothetical protein